MTYYTKDALKEAIQQKLRLNYGCTEKQATDGEIMKACALACGTLWPCAAWTPRSRPRSARKSACTICPWSFSWAAAS